MFFSNGTQYYIAGRFAAFAGLSPVVGNLLHHALEMYLKGRLSKTKTLSELKNLSHNLPRIWGDFKAQFRPPALAQFEGVVTALHAFEELRYPDSVLAKGMSCTISIQRPSATVGPTVIGVAVPHYDLCLEDIDKLVATVFKVVPVNPNFFTGWLNGAAKQWLKEENAESGPTSG